MDEREWHTEHRDFTVSTGERHEGDVAAADEHFSLATLSLGEDAMTPVADLIGFQSTDDERAHDASPVDPESILAEFKGLAARLRAGAETVSDLRGRVEQLLETSAETRRDLDVHRQRLEAGEEAQRRDRETIAQLEERLTVGTQAVADMKTRLGDIMRDFETIL
jgi:hypothetical protein